jgi:hypothetical protein
MRPCLTGSGTCGRRIAETHTPFAANVAAAGFEAIRGNRRFGRIFLGGEAARREGNPGPGGDDQGRSEPESAEPRASWRKAEHLMTSVDQFSDDCRMNEACSTSNKTCIFLSPKRFVVQSIATKRSLDLRADTKPSQ